MKCPKCGFEDDGRFCKECGAPLVSDEKAQWVDAPRYTGITIPPPSASQGFKAEDIEELGIEGDPHMTSGMEGSGSESGNSFGLFLVMILVVAIGIFAFKMLGGG